MLLSSRPSSFPSLTDSCRAVLHFMKKPPACTGFVPCFFFYEWLRISQSLTGPPLPFIPGVLIVSTSSWKLGPTQPLLSCSPQSCKSLKQILVQFVVLFELIFFFFPFKRPVYDHAATPFKSSSVFKQVCDAHPSRTVSFPLTVPFSFFTLFLS